MEIGSTQRIGQQAAANGWGIRRKMKTPRRDIFIPLRS